MPSSVALAAWWKSTQLTGATAIFFLKGVGQTVLLISGAMVMGLALGTVLAALQVYGPAWTRRLAAVYVWFFRGIPVLLLILMVHFGFYSQLQALVNDLFQARVRFPAFLSAVTALGLCSAAYQSQIFRGALMSIPSGQFRAALALGFTPAGAVRGLIMPQALRVSLPAWSNEYSILLKDSAVAFAIGCQELMFRFKSVAATNYKFLLMFALAGLAYYVLTLIGVGLLMKLYRQVRFPGLAEADSH
ncbi:MAG: amino acid ABC transporter permease [Candidatus Adiutrix sp.]|jgi:polar amino acid transport system permease protein|nr:amino acid ABC transporter permease [Candidatus Adiutrix sp.]